MSRDPYAAVVDRVAPGARLTRRWALHGGISARVDALEVVLPGGEAGQMVVREHGAAGWKPAQANVTAVEFALLKALHDAGVRVPEPYLLDTSGELLSSPYLVMAFVDGTTDLDEAALPDALRQMAVFLSDLHALDLTRLQLPSLPRRDDPIPGALEHLPTTDETASLRATLATRGTPQPANSPALLHGDFWPGNVLWKDGRIAAVLDWEDAAIGDPLSDLAGCRVELLWKYGELAMEEFTAHYFSLSKADQSDLPLWEVHVAAGAAAYMGEWNLDPDVEAAMRRKTRRFIARAGQQLGPP